MLLTTASVSAIGLRPFVPSVPSFLHQRKRSFSEHMPGWAVFFISKKPTLRVLSHYQGEMNCLTSYQEKPRRICPWGPDWIALRDLLRDVYVQRGEAFCYSGAELKNCYCHCCWCLSMYILHQLHKKCQHVTTTYKPRFVNYMYLFSKKISDQRSD